MTHTIIVNNKSYDLPKKTVAVTEKLDQALTIDNVQGLNIRKKYEFLYDFVKELLGEENAAEVFEATSLEEIDLSELAMVVLRINDAYEKPMNEYKTAKVEDRLRQIPIEKLTSFTKAAQSVANMQGIKK